MYESMDDEGSEKFSVDSLDYPCTKKSAESLNASKVADNSTIRSSVPFRLHEECGTEPERHLLGFDTAPGTGKAKFSWNCEIDETVLTRKGLQLNEDGSFSKSPREGQSNDLPFVMPAPRVALIRRKKHEMKNSRDDDGFKTTETIQSSGNVVVRTHRSSNAVSKAELSRLKTSGNLTDSMKEALYKKYMNKKSEIPSESCALENFLSKFKKDLSFEGKHKSGESVRLSKKHRADLQLPMIEKPRSLSYFERYQKKNGFDPRSISLKGQKPVEDTVRSKFGDSSRDALSDVSSRCTTVEEDEEEEVFYRKIMAEEGLKGGNSVSDYSDRSFGEIRAVKAVERKKEVKIVNCHKTMKSKESPNGGSLPLRTFERISSGRKICHSCATDHEPLPKAELASKARAYGNLANTRNIVKMQLKSYRRSWEYPGAPEVRKSHAKDVGSFLPPLKDARFSPGGRRGIL